MWDELRALTDRIPVDIVRDDGTTERVWVKSLLDQLAEAEQGTERGSSASGKPKSKPPISIEVIAIRAAIDALITKWRYAHLDRKDALRNIGWLAGQFESDYTDKLIDWADRIRNVTGVERPRVMDLAIICPSCDQSWVARDDEGETVRNRAVYVILFKGTVQSFGCRGCDDDTGKLSAMVDEAIAQYAA